MILTPFPQEQLPARLSRPYILPAERTRSWLTVEFGIPLLRRSVS